MAMVNANMVETCTAPSNIACIKYWGKDNVELNTPINSSVSVTLDQRDLRAVTTVCASQSFTSDRLWLNGVEEPLTDRFETCLREMRARAADRVVDGATVVRCEEWPEYHVHVVSVNTFPTAAGLASSAAGYACLTFSLAQLFAVKEAYPGELSTIARQVRLHLGGCGCTGRLLMRSVGQGSGSACRSLYGGFVRWQKGEQADASDSMAVQACHRRRRRRRCRCRRRRRRRRRGVGCSPGLRRGRWPPSNTGHRCGRWCSSPLLPRRRSPPTFPTPTRATCGHGGGPTRRLGR
jgi:diphosphomevalonate decarboxylase